VPAERRQKSTDDFCENSTYIRIETVEAVQGERLARLGLKREAVRRQSKATSYC
jgi:hypothetical protein